MRTFIIIISLTLIFISGSVYTEFFIKNEIDIMIEATEKISTQEDLKNVCDMWEKVSDYLEIIIDHGDLEEVSKNLWAMEEELKYDFDEFMESKTLTLEMLAHIRDRNTVGLINVL